MLICYYGNHIVGYGINAMQKKSQRNLILGLVGGFAIIIAILASYIAYLQFAPISADTVPEYLVNDDGITEITPPLDVPNFTLTDQFNAPITLDALTNTLTLVTFGFTHCPDVCPITLGEMRRIHDALGNAANSVDFVFVSIDGLRDTPDVLSTYFATLRVDDFVTGLTGTSNEIAPLTETLGVEVIANVPDRLGNYSVDHTAGMFLLDADQNWIRRYRYGTASYIIVEHIQTILDR